jgi:hypothetical protein
MTSSRLLIVISITPVLKNQRVDISTLFHLRQVPRILVVARTQRRRLWRELVSPKSQSNSSAINATRRKDVDPMTVRATRS